MYDVTPPCYFPISNKGGVTTQGYRLIACMRSRDERWPWIVKIINRSYLSAQTELWELPVIRYIRNELLLMFLALAD